MDDEVHRQMTQELVKKKFGRKQKLTSKYQPKYPKQAERELSRITDAYMKIMYKRMKQYLPELVGAMERQDTMRCDDVSDIMTVATVVLEKIVNAVRKDFGKYNLHYKIGRLAQMTEKLSIKEWKKAVKATLGIELTDDVYQGKLMKNLMQEWTKRNTSLIKTIPQDSLTKMRSLVMEGVRNGTPSRELMKEIQSEYDVSKAHARLLARDQIAKLNSSITRFQQEDAGITEYEWSTSCDQRVRASHAKLEGKRFKWSEPPIVDERTGRRCNPGEDYQCRCCALAVFDFNTINLNV